MPDTNSQNRRIDRYAGPYERWVFTEDLGRPFSFPLIAADASHRFTAVMEGCDVPATTPALAIRIPPLWRVWGDPLCVTPFVFEELNTQNGTAALPQDAQVASGLHQVTSLATPGAGQVKPRYRVNFPVVDASWVPVYHENIMPSSWQKSATPPKAIVAVIDDGLPFAHQAFLDSTGKTRISHCWLQAGIAEQEAAVPFGREYTNAQIDTLRQHYGHDEALLYRKAEAIDANVAELGNQLLRKATHGSHVLGVAAGNDSLFIDQNQPDDVQIIAVQLPSTIAWDSSGFGKEMYMLSAIHYVFERARQIAAQFNVPELPLVINFSYGWSAGRHDGQSEMEIAIQELLTRRKAIQPSTALVMPAGNNFGSTMHAQISDARFNRNRYTLGWQLPPDDKTSTYLELWFPEGFDANDYKINIEPPEGIDLDTRAQISVKAASDFDPQGVGDPRQFKEIKWRGANIGQLSADQHRGNRWRVLIALIPTAYTRHQSRRAPCGQWAVTIKRKPTAAPLPDGHDILVWLQRDDDPSDLKSQGQQSYLVDLQSEPGHDAPDDEDMTGVLRGFGAMNGVANSEATVRVAGYDQHYKTASDYSGAGRLRLDDGVLTSLGTQVDIAAVSDQSKLRPGSPSIGVLSGARARLVGTSGAAPSAVRHMVHNAHAGRDLFHGMQGQLPIDGHMSRVKHSARIGDKTVPPNIKS